ncbi:leucine-rich repeat domain-containing protein [Tuwongella immobilis]|uniref:Repeat-companion domain protein n=1 Tax=Tuwongella immobilis TaxID=692036 RepID=A0A6C2YVT0_9BACT|nr:hypothetical protein [Tuwongella immobilis]VIP04972.1 unnamed protein product [Tuwongella immobilis]VTS07302.1 unnamed protein product [Tuwongella immobilis]
MNPPDELLDAVYLGEDPTSATLMLADWYEEQGEVDRARCMRAVIQARALPPDDPQLDQAIEQSEQLIFQHGARWAADAFRDALERRHSLGAVGSAFRPMGLTQTISVSNLATWLPTAEAELNATPARYLSLPVIRRMEEFLPLLQHPIAERIRGLWLTVGTSDVHLPTRLLESDAAQALRLEHFSLHPVGGEVGVLQSAALARVRSLRLVELLSQAEWLPALSQFSAAARVRRLSLLFHIAERHFDRRVMQFFNGVTYSQCEELVLGNVRFPEGVRPELPARAMPLRKLMLSQCDIPPEWGQHLGAFLANTPLQSLTIGTGFGPMPEQFGRTLLAMLTPLTQLRHLRLLNVPITSQGATVLSMWPGWRQLTELEYSLMELSEAESARLLRELTGGACRSLTLQLSEEQGRSLDWLGAILPVGRIRNLRLMRRASSERLSDPVSMGGLLQSPMMRQLRTLTLEGFPWGRLTSERMRHLLDMPELTQLRWSGISIRASDLDVLIDNPGLPRLWCLDLRGLTPDALERIRHQDRWLELGAGVLICPERMGWANQEEP